MNAVVEEALLLLAQPDPHPGRHAREAARRRCRSSSADFGQLRQAFVNVIMNACEAMATGGRLAIESALVEDGKWVEVAFTDTGPGIPPEHLSQDLRPVLHHEGAAAPGSGSRSSTASSSATAARSSCTSEVGKGTRMRSDPRCPATARAAASGASETARAGRRTGIYRAGGSVRGRSIAS